MDQFQMVFKKKKGSTYICPNHGANLNLIPQGRYLPGLAGSLERNEWDKGEEVSYTTRHAHLYTCGSWTGCESIPVSQRLLQHVEILWLSKCVVVETVPALTNVGHVTQQQCHSCAWVVIFTRPIIGSQTKIKILAGQCSTQFELDGMGKRKQVLLLCWISVGKTQNQEGANNHHMCL